jgi:hypothetical protein
MVVGVAGHRGHDCADGGACDDGHDHVAIACVGCACSNQGAGQDKGLGHLRNHGVSFGERFGIAMDVSNTGFV